MSEETRANLDALLAILDEDGDRLASLPVNKGILINQIKNNLEALEWYLRFTYGEPQGNLNLFSCVKSPTTYDLYKQFGIEPNAFGRDVVSDVQWEYLEQLDLTPETYCEDCAISCHEEMDPRAQCEACSIAGLSIDDDLKSEHEVEHGHAYEPMRIRITQNEGGVWFANGSPIDMFCPICNVQVSQPMACAVCLPKITDGDPLVRLVRLDRPENMRTSIDVNCGSVDTVTPVPVTD